ncbi:hypothetical protein [Paracoccus sp. S1E-3]|uniref:hypothetical protein n=1 Tax=Paracoccus sp. S1E-3 TaxID=2756130 RepID=UPI0015EFD9CD|nr:hypothetical protein [Paracoccus sp. S1E-3]MBA4490551.1 hypothetical protein [Paracoccus sp. S1E-3]
MTVNIRYRLIQILEILLWLGAVAGIAMIGRRAWALREEGASAVLNAASPGLLGIGAVMAALIVMIGIYHNSRRSAEAMDRMSRQSAGGMRRLPGVARGDVPVPVVVQSAPVVAAAAPAPMPAAAPVAAPVAPPVMVAAPPPVAAPASAPVTTPPPVFTTPAMGEPEPAPVIPHVVPAAPAETTLPESRPAPQRLRAGIRRLGPAI